MAKTKTPGIQELTKTRRDGTSYVVYRATVGSGKLRESFTDESFKKVERWLWDTRVAKENGTHVKLERGIRTFGDVAEEWLASNRKVNQNSRDTHASRLRTIESHGFSNRRVDLLEEDHLVALIARLEKTGAPKTVQAHVRLVRTVLRYAVKKKYIAVSPAGDVETPVGRRKLIVPPEPEEFMAILDASHRVEGRAGGYPWLPPAITTAGFTGARLSELFAITNDRLHGVGNVVSIGGLSGQGAQLHIDRQLSRWWDDAHPHFLPPKSQAGDRFIPLASHVVDALLPLMARPGPEGLLFLNPRSGGPVLRSSARRGLLKTLEAAGMAGRDLTWHDFRHYFVSLLIAAGLDALSIKTYVGHDSIATTYDEYGHLFKKSADAARAALEGAFLGETEARENLGRNTG